MASRAHTGARAANAGASTAGAMLDQGVVAAPATSALQSALGNQAVLRMLHGQASSPGGEAILNRQDAGAGNPANMPTTAPQTPLGGPGQGAAPTGGSGWSASMLDASIEDNNNSQCLGTVSAGGGLRFSTNCGNIRAPFCQPAGVDFRVDFSVDAVNVPRPAGFTPPTVSAQLIFVNSAGSPTQNINKRDTKPKYVSAGVPLEPAFGHAIAFSTMESGWLHIHLQLADPDSGATIDYNDRVTFTVTPCI